MTQRIKLPYSCESLYVSASSNYLDIDDILASQGLVPCKFELPVYGLGFLDPSTAEPDLHAGTKLDLPCWLASALCSRKRHVVSIELPKPYREHYREILDADAQAVDLHKIGPYFYQFGMTLLAFPNPECREVASTLHSTFVHRYRHVMDSAQNRPVDTSREAVESRLDHVEKVLLATGQRVLAGLSRWERRDVARISASAMVTRYKKRKLDDLDQE